MSALEPVFHSNASRIASRGKEKPESSRLRFDLALLEVPEAKGGWCADSADASGKVVLKVFLLILDSLGSTELLFILVMALVFFGPRKLPQLSRSLGKNLAEFRKASEDFKRTWEREVAFEESTSETDRERATLPENNSIMNSEIQHKQFLEPVIEPVAAADVVSRNTTASTADSILAAETSEPADESTRSEPPRKQDWL